MIAEVVPIEILNMLVQVVAEIEYWEGCVITLEAPVGLGSCR